MVRPFGLSGGLYIPYITLCTVRPILELSIMILLIDLWSVFIPRHQGNGHVAILQACRPLYLVLSSRLEFVGCISLESEPCAVSSFRGGRLRASESPIIRLS